MQLPIDKTWTLFLDRDGVINEKLENDYVRNISQFKLLPGTLEALKIFSQKFGRVIIVTNQQGIGKGLMTHDDVKLIHNHLMSMVKKEGARIDDIFYAPYLKEENHPNRKPNAGMALGAKKKFPDIDFSRSIIAGDSKSDMQFGDNAGMKKVFISSHPDPVINYDYTYNTLLDFAKSL
jgi:histidinol-phosphate phosphatase family protein